MMTSPLGETNEPLPPELNRTLAFRRCSSHCWVGSNWYLSFSCLSGGLSNNHMPSSAFANEIAIKTKQKTRSFICRI